MDDADASFLKVRIQRTHLRVLILARLSTLGLIAPRPVPFFRYLLP